MLPTKAPYPYFTDLDGDPLDSGYLYFGSPNQNPETAPIQVYWDEEGQTPAAQPIRTLNGFPVRAGTVANIYVDTPYAITVKDKKQRLIYSGKDSTDFTSDWMMQPGAGAVPRPIKEKALESISVKDFGAKGDGVTDDTVAIQAAIDYVANLSPGGTASGGTLKFPPGEYLIASAPGLIMPANKPMSLLGEGAGSKLRSGVGSGQIIECRSSSRITNLFFKGPVSGTSNGIYLNGANTAVVEDCYFQNQTTGITLTSSYAVEIISCIFDVCYTYGLAATTSAHNTVIDRCNFFTCGVLNSGQAIRFEVSSDNLVIQNNDFEYCNVNFTLNACNSVRITGNYMEYHKGACFDFGAGCTGIIIESNWIALGDVAGGNVATLQNITGGRFAHNTIYNQTVNFSAVALVGFDVWLNLKIGTGTLGPAPWQGPVLLNSWAQQAGYTTPGFIKDSAGWVHLRGALVGGVAPNILFNLPAAYRPAAIAVFGTSSTSGDCRITVNPNGDVVPTVAASNNASLDGISFYVG